MNAETERVVRVCIEQGEDVPLGLAGALLAEIDQLRRWLAVEAAHVERLVAANEELCAELDRRDALGGAS